MDAHLWLAELIAYDGRSAGLWKAFPRALELGADG